MRQPWRDMPFGSLSRTQTNEDRLNARKRGQAGDCSGGYRNTCLWVLYLVRPLVLATAFLLAPALHIQSKLIFTINQSTGAACEVLLRQSTCTAERCPIRLTVLVFTARPRKHQTICTLASFALMHMIATASTWVAACALAALPSGAPVAVPVSGLLARSS